MNRYIFILLTLFIFSQALSSCENKEKEALISRYSELAEMIEKSDNKAIYNNLDGHSREFVKFLEAYIKELSKK